MLTRVRRRGIGADTGGRHRSRGAGTGAEGQTGGGEKYKGLEREVQSLVQRRIQGSAQRTIHSRSTHDKDS